MRLSVINDEGWSFEASAVLIIINPDESDFVSNGAATPLSSGMQNEGISIGGVTGIGILMVNSRAVIANVKAILSHV
jgi:hypothetical protein